jgi:hypothetical protein
METTESNARAMPDVIPSFPAVRQGLLLLTAALSFFNAGIIWFTEVAVYPLWPLIGKAEFHRYHTTWWHDVWLSFVPVALVLLGTVAMLWKRPLGVPAWGLWLALGLQILTHIVTVFFFAPVQIRMAGPNGLSMPAFQELMATHWLRVALVWSVAIVMFWLLHRSFQFLWEGRAIRVPRKQP